MDILATLTPTEYRHLRTQLRAEGLWHGGTGTRADEDRANARAEQILTACHRAQLDAWGWQSRVHGA